MANPPYFEPHDLVEFKWENLYKEVQERAPTFYTNVSATAQSENYYLLMLLYNS